MADSPAVLRELLARGVEDHGDTGESLGAGGAGIGAA